MRVFVTGATGFIGSKVVEDLQQAGHRVLGMARSDAGMKALAAVGVEAHRGDIEDLDSLRTGAQQCDGVIHLAFNHDDFSRFAINCANDAKAIETLGSTLAGSKRPLVITSGTGMAQGRPVTENDPPPPSTLVPRGASEEALDALVKRGVNGRVVRLPQVHDPDKQGLVTYLISLAKERGVSAYVGDGKNRWPGAPRLAAAQLYRLVLEKGVAGGRYNAVAEQGVPLKEIAEAIGKRVKVPVASKPVAEAAAHFGWLAPFVQFDLVASSAQTQQQLDWHPTGPGLIADILAG